MPNAGRHAPRLILADDHRMVVQSLARMLNHRFSIAGVAHDGDGLIELLPRCPADVLLLDLEMPGRNGLEVLADVRRLRPELRIIILTMLLDRQVADAAIHAGAHGYVPKEAPLPELELAIRAVLGGAVHISPRVPKTSHRVGLDARHRAMCRLTPRQQQIVLMLGEGRSFAEISRQLHVGASTVTFHKRNIMRVLAINAERELFRYAVLLREGVGSSRGA